MPVLFATWEAEIRRITVKRLDWANSLQDLISKITEVKMDWKYGSSSRTPALQM
jgi:hypothetical protein